jgi:hypothetical protein
VARFEGGRCGSTGRIGSVEEDMMPPDALRRLKGSGQRRRNSMSERLLGESAMSVHEGLGSKVTPE